MNIQSLVVVVLRLVALDFLLRVVVQLTPQLLSFARYAGRSVADDSRSFMVVPLLLVAGLVAAAAVLWFLAVPIARSVTRGVEQNLSLNALTLADCYSVAFVGVGLLYITSHLPQVLNWAHYMMKTAASGVGDSWKQQVQWYDMSQAIVTFIMGVVLLVKGRSWAVTLARRDTVTVESPTAAEEEHEAGT